MATLLKTPPPLHPRLLSSSTLTNALSFKSINPFSLSFTPSTFNTKVSRTSCLRVPAKASLRFSKFVSFASQGETETETTEAEEKLQEPETQDSSDGAVGEDSADESEDSSSSEEAADAEETPSQVSSLIQSYKEALASNDESKITEIESILKSFEDEKIGLEAKVAGLTEELSTERDRVLRISADFDNFRKRTERERLSLVTNTQGEVLESLLPVLDNFERAKSQIKLETEGEEKINNSYQSIYKQFVEILGSLGVVPVETIGKPFDPLLHEAIMQEESTEFEEGIILEEYRKGFQIGERLLRPSMVKVSSGPGPAKTEEATDPPHAHGESETVTETETETEISEQSSGEAES